MNRPLREIHRRAFVGLAVVVPVVLLIGMRARRRPDFRVVSSSLPATWYVVKQSSSLWQKHTILSTFYSTPSRPQEIHVDLAPARELNEPDLLVYWTDDAPLEDALPAQAQFVGAFAAGKPFLLPLGERRAGHLILFSPAVRAVFDTANVETLP